MFAIKVHIKCVPNTAGTPGLENFVPTRDAPVIEALRNEGALFMAKANLHELCFGVTSNNAEYGTCRNSKNMLYSPGGSSGGTGAAIGAHLVPCGLGTDTGGSVRIPSSVNGIVGLRPTQIRYSNVGVTPLSFTRDTIGPMANFVEDLILMDEVISGQVYEDSNTSNGLHGIRLGVSSDYLCNNLVPEVEKAFENAKQTLIKNGAELIEINSTELLKANADCSFDYLFYETNQDLSQYLLQHNINLSLEDINDKIASSDVKELFKFVMKKSGKTSLDYSNLINVKRVTLKRAYQEIFNTYNIQALVFPTLPCLPVEISNFNEGLIAQFIRNMDPGSQAGK